MNDGKSRCDSPPEYLLTKDAGDVLKNMSGLPDNAYLSFNRFTTYKVDKKEQKRALRPLIQTKSCSCPLAQNKAILEMLGNRMRGLAAALPRHLELTFTPDSKLAIGIGTGSPYGNINLMTLHPVYGVPYIPASALKGAVRHCWIQEKSGGCEEKAEEDPDFTALFGASGEDGGPCTVTPRSGTLVFFDSFPIAANAPGFLTFDVMTPHYQEYYESKGKVEPTDDQNPVPIQFPVVKGTTFQINIGGVNAKEWDSHQEELKDIVKNTFSRYGIGAKTALGYGIGTVQYISD